MQEKWDKAYSGDKQAGEARWVLKENAHLLPAKGISLDLASGLGANALLLARHGLESHAWDISPVALEKLTKMAQEQNLKVLTEQRDIENSPPPANSFDVIVVSHFLHRPLCADLVNALKLGGLLFYQTYHQDKIGNHGPNSARFLLEPQELLSLFNPLEILFYREDGRQGNLDKGLRDIAYFVGRKPL
jgi:2-polyprenyl-3-methyl-5-hydroxy-6-metoxy-1,4-benzoquinol methylase